MAMLEALSPSKVPARWQDFLQLLKPRVMSLVVFTAATGLVCAERPIHPFLGFVAVLCVAIGAGASGAGSSFGSREQPPKTVTVTAQRLASHAPVRIGAMIDRSTRGSPALRCGDEF